MKNMIAVASKVYITAFKTAKIKLKTNKKAYKMRLFFMFRFKKMGNSDVFVLAFFKLYFSFISFFKVLLLKNFCGYLSF